MHSLIKLDQSDKSLHEYTQKFNSSYSYWKDDISVKVASYLYIGGLRNGSLRADLMSNWQSSKYATLMALQTDDAKNSLWRSSTVITPRSGGSSSHQNKGKSPMTQPNFKRPQLSNFGQKNSGSHGSFGGSGQKGASGSKGPWGQSKDDKANFKVSSKSVSFNKKHETGEE